MSLAVLTDSTTAQASPALTLRPTAGSSTNTMSVSSCCAWSVMPTVAVSPLTRTHSWVLAYFKSAGILLIKFQLLNVCVRRFRLQSLPSFSVDRLRHDDGGEASAANLNLNLRVGFRQ